MNVKDPLWEKLARNIALIDKRLEKAGKRIGLSPYETDHYIVTAEQMAENLVYVAMPAYYSHWRYGKRALQERGGAYEVVVNSDPSFCYLQNDNDLAIQMLVIAHAKWGHVDFFANNRLFRETGAKDIIQRLRNNADFITSLYEHPDWGRQGVELYLDAAHALEYHVGWLPTLEGERHKVEEELRKQLMEDLRNLKAQYELTRVEMDRQIMARDIQALENRLKCHPLSPTTDLLGYLADPANTKHLPPEARQLIMIVREQSRYFQPQGRTKFMNEGWATYWEKELPLQPEVGLPFNLHFDLARHWTMFDRSPSNLYLDPYALGEAVWRYIDKKFGYDEGSVTVRRKDLVYDEVRDELSEGKMRKKTAPKRNRDKMFEVRRNYDDNRFLEEFMDKDFFEFINGLALKWLVGDENHVGVMEHINRALKVRGWGPQLVFDPLPETIAVYEPDPWQGQRLVGGLMFVVQTWMNAQQNLERWRQFVGTPNFPVHPQTLQQMMTILQIVAAYDENRHELRKQLIRRTGYNMMPHIQLEDSGRFTDGWHTVRHIVHPEFGPLLPSECRETLRYFRLLCGGPCRLYTLEQREDWMGRPVGDLVPYVYYTEDGDTVKEEFV